MVVRPEPFRLTGPRPTLDRRCHVIREDLVEITLADRIAAARYVAPLKLRCVQPAAALRAAPDTESAAVSELLHGEDFDVFELAGGWAFGRCCADRYVGWVAEPALAEPGSAPVFGVFSRSAPQFARADIKSPVQHLLPFGARLGGQRAGDFIAVDGGGFVHHRHVEPLPAASPLDVAALFTGAPYVWGGRTPAGVDCSGMVQAAAAACGFASPRDSDQQRESLGDAVDFADRAPGDIIFFPGHVGLAVDRDTLFHANAWWMTTLAEPLGDVIARLQAAGFEEPILAVRRLPSVATAALPLTSA